jgi:hypothetical protein
MADIAPLSTLSAKPPSPALKHSVVNLLFSYCYVSRYYNGEYHWTPLEAGRELVEVCAALEAGTHFEDTRTSLQATIQPLVTRKATPIQFILQLLSDTKTISESKELALRSLSDVARLMKSAVNEAKEGHESKELKNKLILVSKKCDFFVSWAFDCGHELPEAVLDIDMELVNMKSHEKMAQEVQAFSGRASDRVEKKLLIEEL